MKLTHASLLLSALLALAACEEEALTPPPPQSCKTIAQFTFGSQVRRVVYTYDVVGDLVSVDDASIGDGRLRRVSRALRSVVVTQPPDGLGVDSFALTLNGRVAVHRHYEGSPEARGDWDQRTYEYNGAGEVVAEYLSTSDAPTQQTVTRRFEWEAGNLIRMIQNPGASAFYTRYDYDATQGGTELHPVNFRTYILANLSLMNTRHLLTGSTDSTAANGTGNSYDYSYTFDGRGRPVRLLVRDRGTSARRDEVILNYGCN